MLVCDVWRAVVVFDAEMRHLMFWLPFEQTCKVVCPPAPTVDHTPARWVSTEES